MKKVAISWSSGKDCAYALHLAKQRPDWEVVSLVTNYRGSDKRVGIHSTPLSLVQAQADSADIPLMAFPLPDRCPDTIYEKEVYKAALNLRQAGVTTIVFGDLFLEDIRDYRERVFGGTGLELEFPLWKSPTKPLALKIIQTGIKAVMVSVNTQKMSSSYCGKYFDTAFVNSLPPTIDACGENGEFHTFVFESPDFRNAIPFELGATSQEGSMAQVDIQPVKS